MGGSKKVTVGHFHDKDMQMSLCHGPIDAITEIRVADRVAHVQWMDKSGTYTIDKENLFGGKSQEGGIKGQFDLMMGLPDQPVNPYIQEMVGEEQAAYVPAYRRLVTVLLKKMYVGMNPYWRNWLFLCNRVFQKDGGQPQWYIQKAGINPITVHSRSKINRFSLILDGSGSMQGSKLTALKNALENLALAIENDVIDIQNISITIFSDSSRSANATGTQNCADLIREMSSSYVASGGTNAISAFAETINYLVEPTANDLIVVVSDGDMSNVSQARANISHISTVSKIAGVGIGTIGSLASFHNMPYSIPVVSGEAGQITDAIVLAIKTMTNEHYDLNAAHIIREALTSREWGKGATNIDDVAFKKMADQLYEEGLGISIHWQQSTSVNELLKLICDHVGAVFPYVDTTTGLWTSRLIRDDQIPVNTNDLVHLHDGNIVKIRNPKIRKGANAVNTVHVKYTEVESNSVGLVSANSLSGIAQASGSIIAETVEYKGFTTKKNAMWACRRDLQTLSARVKSVEIEAHDDIAEDLQKGDFFWWSNRRLGIDRALMMVQEIDFGDYLSNTVSIKAIEYAFRPPQNSIVEYIPTKPNVNIPPEQAEILLFEAPYREAVQRFGEREVNDQLAYDETSSYLLVAVKRPQDNATGATLFTSVGGEYEEGGVIDFCTTAQLRNDIDQLESVFELKNITDAAFLEVGLAIEINGERMYLVDFNSLTREATVKRGIDDTIPRSHSADSTVWFYDEFAVADETTYTDLQTIFVKASTTTQTDALSLSTATEHSLVMCARMNRPYPPANVQINGEYWLEEVKGYLELTWVHRNRLQQTGGEAIGWFESNVTTEDGVTYVIELYDQNNVLISATDVGSVTSAIVDYSSVTTAKCKLKLYSMRDGYSSYQAFEHELTISFDPPYNVSGVFNETTQELELTWDFNE